MAFHRTILAAAALLATSAIVAPAQAQYTVSNTNGGDGYLTTGTAPFAFQLWGANNGVGSNITFATATAASTGTLSLDYSYSTGDQDGSSYDPAGYFINGNLFQLTANGSYAVQSGTAVFNLNAGDSYGFYVYSTDSCCGPAQISFSAAPEPASWAMMLGGFGLVGGALRNRRKVAIRFA